MKYFQKEGREGRKGRRERNEEGRKGVTSPGEFERMEETDRHTARGTDRKKQLIRVTEQAARLTDKEKLNIEVKSE